MVTHRVRNFQAQDLISAFGRGRALALPHLPLHLPERAPHAGEDFRPRPPPGRGLLFCVGCIVTKGRERDFLRLRHRAQTEPAGDDVLGFFHAGLFQAGEELHRHLRP